MEREENSAVVDGPCENSRLLSVDMSELGTVQKDVIASLIIPEKKSMVIKITNVATMTSIEMSKEISKN